MNATEALKVFDPIPLGNYFHRPDSMDEQHITGDQIRILMDAGFIREHNNGYNAYFFELTPKGKKAAGGKFGVFHRSEMNKLTQERTA